MNAMLNHVPQPSPSVNDIVVSVLSTSILVLAGIVSIAQFAYY